MTAIVKCGKISEDNVEEVYLNIEYCITTVLRSKICKGHTLDELYLHCRVTTGMCTINVVLVYYMCII